MKATENKYVSIPESEYVQLRKDQERLDALDEMGVDNWEGYGDAMKILKKEVVS